jgi:hypothetical protein
MAPNEFAAYTAPTVLPESSPGRATAARASGKLAPHRIVPGRMAQQHRARSSWKVYHGLSESNGLTGQNGSDSFMAIADQAMPSVSKNLHQPSARRGRTSRTSAAATPLPMAKPIKKTARMIEKT